MTFIWNLRGKSLFALLRCTLKIVGAYKQPGLLCYDPVKHWQQKGVETWRVNMNPCQSLFWLILPFSGATV